MISLTENAVKEISKVVKENQLPEGTGIRLGIKGGGCAGFTYVFDFDDKVGDFDEVFESMGIKIIVDKKSLIYIDGTQVDFNTSLMDRGFKFLNPKADAACGCGTSFTPKAPTL
ncbi:MAG: iron-sulfur cluster assembly accessory protein [Deltaproteobacteria bacterium]|nr:iron-sulfur cluster assembly accessory protein [Deltaproteobacteria bacterium]